MIKARYRVHIIYPSSGQERQVGPGACWPACLTKIAKVQLETLSQKMREAEWVRGPLGYDQNTLNEIFREIIKSGGSD